VGKPSPNAAQPYAKAEGRVFLLVPAYPGCPEERPWNGCCCCNYDLTVRCGDIMQRVEVILGLFRWIFCVLRHRCSLPKEHYQRPSIGNGYLATVVHGDNMYMSGVYNGEGSESHRAVIPSTCSFVISSVEPPATLHRTHELNVAAGSCPWCIVPDGMEQSLARLEIPQVAQPYFQSWIWQHILDEKPQFPVGAIV